MPAIRSAGAAAAWLTLMADDGRRCAAVERQEQPLEARMVVDDVESLTAKGVVDPGQVGRQPSDVVGPAEVVAPGGVGQHRHPGLGVRGPEYGHIVSQAAKLPVQEVDDQFRAAVSLGRQRVPGRRHDRDPKGVLRRAHLLLCLPGAASIIPVG